MTRTMTSAEQTVCATLLDDAAVLIDAYGSAAGADAKKTVSCRMVIRAMGDGGSIGVPQGATQGSMSALGYSQSEIAQALKGIDLSQPTEEIIRRALRAMVIRA